MIVKLNFLIRLSFHRKCLLEWVLDDEIKEKEMRYHLICNVSNSELGAFLVCNIASLLIQSLVVGRAQNNNQLTIAQVR